MIWTEAKEHFFLNWRTKNNLSDTPANRQAFIEVVASNKAVEKSKTEHAYKVGANLYKMVRDLFSVKHRW